MTKYVAKGDVRGECPHYHNSPRAAAMCAERDHKACRRLGGGAYSDRTVERADGEPLEDWEKEEVEQVLNPSE